MLPETPFNGSTIKVLYIAGSGRTGSTIVSLILSQADRTFNVAQARSIWSAFAKNAPCTCGKPLQSCSHWSAVFASFAPGDPEAYARDIARLAARFRRDASRLRGRQGQKALHDLKKSHAPFLAALRDLYVGSARISGANILVDSSKAPEFAIALSLVPELEPWVINLVRDPRAVAVSWARKLGSAWKALPYCMKWRSRQRKIRNWTDFLQGRVMEISYEDFAWRPAETIRQVQQWAGVEVFLRPFLDSRNLVLSWSGQHLFPPANERVISKRESEVAILAPADWRQLRWFHLRFLALLLTFPDCLAFVGRNDGARERQGQVRVESSPGGRT